MVLNLPRVGAGCSDPGTNAGTEQLPAGNYDPGQLVSYSCTQAGFELSESSPLLCEISGGAMPDWNGTAPTCSGTMTSFLKILLNYLW